MYMLQFIEGLYDHLMGAILGQVFLKAALLPLVLVELVTYLLKKMVLLY
jgi:hypothetical protein